MKVPLSSTYVCTQDAIHTASRRSFGCCAKQHSVGHNANNSSASNRPQHRRLGRESPIFRLPVYYSINARNARDLLSLAFFLSCMDHAPSPPTHPSTDNRTNPFFSHHTVPHLFVEKSPHSSPPPSSIRCASHDVYCEFSFAVIFLQKIQQFFLKTPYTYPTY